MMFFRSSAAKVHKYIESKGDFVISPTKLAKIRRPKSEGGHLLSDKVIVETQKRMYDPVAIFVSETVKNRLVIIPGNLDSNGDPMVVAVEPDKTHDRRISVEIFSIHSRGAGSFWDKPVKQTPNLIQMLDEKKWDEFLQTARLQMPMVEEIRPDNKNSIVHRIVKTKDDGLFSEDAPSAQLDAVRARYKGTPQWLKAPNGADTKLTEQQWLTVRTVAFKRWLGQRVRLSRVGLGVQAEELEAGDQR